MLLLSESGHHFLPWSLFKHVLTPTESGHRSWCFFLVDLAATALLFDNYFVSLVIMGTLILQDKQSVFLLLLPSLTRKKWVEQIVHVYSIICLLWLFVCDIVFLLFSLPSRVFLSLPSLAFSSCFFSPLFLIKHDMGCVSSRYSG